MLKMIKKVVNPDLAKEKRELNVFLMGKKSVPEYLEEEMENFRGMPAVKDELSNVEMTYDDVIENLNYIASAMQSLGIQKGDKVALISENNGRHFIFDQGIMKAGAASALRGTGAPVEELEYIMKHSDSKALVISDYKNLARLKDVVHNNPDIKFVAVMFEKGERPEGMNIPVYSYEEFIDIGKNHTFVDQNISVDDTAAILYTSGTTGLPKGVELSHKNFLVQFPSFKVCLEYKAGENTLHILPIWHSYEKTTQMYCFLSGCYLHFTTLPHLKTDLARYNIDAFMSVPRIWEALRLGIYQKIKQTSKLSYFIFDFAIRTSIYYKIHKMYSEKRTPNKKTSYKWTSRVYHKIARSFIKPLHILFTRTLYKKIKDQVGLMDVRTLSGGGALSLKDELFYDAIGVNFRTGYGLTETAPLLTVRRISDPNYLCSVGRPVLGVEMKIVDPETDEELGIYQKGLVKIRAMQLMKGYYKDEEATKKVIDEDGWFNTGDLGWLTGENNLVLVGRMKETIVLSNGENIEPLPIEEACLGSPYIAQIILVGQDESSLGALVVPSEEALKKCGMAAKEMNTGKSLSIKDPDLHQLIKKEINSYIKNKQNLKPFEKIKQFEVLKESFNMENGLLSQSGKTKRNSVFEKYKDTISKMFSDKK